MELPKQRLDELIAEATREKKKLDEKDKQASTGAVRR